MRFPSLGLVKYQQEKWLQAAEPWLGSAASTYSRLSTALIPGKLSATINQWMLPLLFTTAKLTLQTLMKGVLEGHQLVYQEETRGNKAFKWIISSFKHLRTYRSASNFLKHRHFLHTYLKVQRMRSFKRKKATSLKRMRKTSIASGLWLIPEGSF